MKVSLFGFELNKKAVYSRDNFLVLKSKQRCLLEHDLPTNNLQLHSSLTARGLTVEEVKTLPGLK
tara:strand:- start:3479 stop:3673 length:195 start_codon:yes stop_codon:yes gene_type:complete